MSMNYSPELVRALMQERLLEAQDARLAKTVQRDYRVSTADFVRGQLARLLPGRSAAQAVPACQTC
jgi:hypothetical protein